MISLYTLSSNRNFWWHQRSVFKKPKQFGQGSWLAVSNCQSCTTQCAGRVNVCTSVVTRVLYKNICNRWWTFFSDRVTHVMVFSHYIHLWNCNGMKNSLLLILVNYEPCTTYRKMLESCEHGLGKLRICVNKHGFCAGVGMKVEQHSALADSWTSLRILLNESQPRFCKVSRLHQCSCHTHLVPESRHEKVDSCDTRPLCRGLTFLQVDSLHKTSEQRWVRPSTRADRPGWCIDAAPVLRWQRSRMHDDDSLAPPARSSLADHQSSKVL